MLENCVEKSCHEVGYKKCLEKGYPKSVVLKFDKNDVQKGVPKRQVQQWRPKTGSKKGVPKYTVCFFFVLFLCACVCVSRFRVRAQKCVCVGGVIYLKCSFN